MTFPNPAEAVVPGILALVGRPLLRLPKPMSLSLLLLLPALVAAQVGPTLKSLVTARGSITVGDVTITNFRTPFEWPMVFVDGPAMPDRRDRTAVSATVVADGNVDPVFTAIDPLTGLPLPQVSATAVPNDYLAFVTYDVVVTNPGRVACLQPELRTGDHGYCQYIRHGLDGAPERCPLLGAELAGGQGSAFVEPGADAAVFDPGLGEHAGPAG